MRKLTVLTLMFAAGTVWLSAGEKMNMKPYDGSANFMRLKKLAGKWEGTGKMEGKDQKVSVEYRVTSGGSALEERLSPGTPHEMISMYYDKGGKVAMTHYCMIGNRPEMELKSADDKSLKFELAKGGEVKPKDIHMHSLEIVFDGDKKMSQNWISFEGGKPNKETTIFNYKRVK